MSAPLKHLTAEQRLARKLAQGAAATARWRAKRHGDATRDATTNRSDITPSPSPSPNPSLATQETPPPVARSIARLVAFGRGYVSEPARLEKLFREFPHLDVEEQVAAALDWEGWDLPKNRRKKCSVEFLRNWCKKSEADRVAPPVARPQSNGVYHQPISRQGRNPGPPDLPLFEAPVQRIDPGEMARFVAGRREAPLAERVAGKLARLRGGER